MSVMKPQSPDSKNQSIIIALFIALFIIGGGAAYLIITRKPPENPTGNQEGKQEKEQKVISPRSLVEAPPPLPEDTPTLPVMDASSDGGVSTSGSAGKKHSAGITGTIDPKEATSFIKSNTNKVRACYERELKINNILQGVVKTQIIVNPDGSVANVNFLSDTVGSPTMKKCIRNEILSWKFPKPEGGRAEVQFPFRFEPKHN